MTRERTTFHWRNYTKPTPKNLLYWAGVIRDAVTFAAGSSILMNLHPWIPVAILILGFVLDKAKNFFSYVIEEEGDLDVTVTKETFDEKSDSQQANA